MKRYLLTYVVFLLLASKAHATITMIQHPSNGACGSGTTCVITIASTGSGHLLVAAALYAHAGTAITSVSGAGTWALCAASVCTSSESDMAYNLSSTSGATTITVNFSSTLTAGAVEIIEYSFTSASIAFDVGGNLSSPGNTSSPGVALTLTGTNDVIVQATTGTAALATAVTSPYTNPADFPDGGDGVAGSINTTSGAAPTWTFNNGAGTNFFSALAIKEVSAVLAPGSKIGGPSKLGGPSKIT